MTFVFCQVTQIASQPQVQAELTLRLTQLQTRLASLKIENEEVRHTQRQDSWCIYEAHDTNDEMKTVNR